MNARIKELAREAGIVNRKFSFGQWWETDLTTEQKKFAELIVRECADRATWAQDTNAKDIGGEVLKHFGVDE